MYSKNIVFSQNYSQCLVYFRKLTQTHSVQVSENVRTKQQRNTAAQNEAWEIWSYRHEPDDTQSFTHSHSHTPAREACSVGEKAMHTEWECRCGWSDQKSEVNVVKVNDVESNQTSQSRAVSAGSMNAHSQSHWHQRSLPMMHTAEERRWPTLRRASTPQWLLP